MKIFVSLFIFLSLFLMQTHELSHASFDHHTQSHKCAVCDVQVHQVSLAPTKVIFELTSFYEISSNVIYSHKTISPKLFVSKCHNPRAPPFA